MRHVFDHTPTAQEVFNEACIFFAKSPGPSVRKNGRTDSGWECVYRGDDCRVCIVGYFLPDSAYVPEMDDPDKFSDGSDIKALVRHYGQVPEWFGEHVSLLKSLQNYVHDDESNWRNSRAGHTWHRENVVYSLRTVAHDHHIEDLSAIELVRNRPNWTEVEV